MEDRVRLIKEGVLDLATILNNKYELDGSGSNGYTGVVGQSAEYMTVDGANVPFSGEFDI